MIKRTLLLMLISLVYHYSSAQDCACTNINIKLDENGEGTVTPAMIIANERECDPLDYVVELMDAEGNLLLDENGLAIPVDAFRCNHVGEVIMAALIGPGTVCMASVTIEDKTAPTCTALPDITLQCDDDISPLLLRYDTIRFDAGPIGRGGMIPSFYSNTKTSGGSGRIVGLRMHIEASIVDLSDLTIRINSPSGVDYTLMETPAGSCSLQSDLNVVFNQEGSVFDCSLLTGEIQPEVSDLSDLYGSDKLGNWMLRASDIGVPGSMDNAYLVIAYDYMATGIDNCSFSIQHEDDLSGLNLCNIGEVFRTFTVTDAEGRSDQCTQIITLENSENPPYTVEWPRDTMFACDSSYDSSPTLEGAGMPIVTNVKCSRALPSLTLEERYNENSPGCITILRYWRVRDWCSNVVMDIPAPQEIKIIDTVKPDITCPIDLTMSVGDNCLLDLTGRVPTASASDNCDSDVSISHEVRNAVGMVLSDLTALAVGDYFIHYTASDDCANDSTCITMLTALDDTNPQATCDGSTNVTLDGTGNGTVCWQTINDGSMDNCMIDSIRLSRDGINYTECIDFDCSDVGTPVEGWMKVWDNSGNSSECDFEVLVKDGNAPIVHNCAPNISVPCWENLGDLDILGRPDATDNCVDTMLTYVDNRAGLNACDLGDVVRTFTITDNSGNSATCDQIITLIPSSNVMVTFPRDTTVECLANTDQNNTGVPVITGDSCNNYATRLAIDTESGTCVDGDWMIERVWRVEHKCNPASYFQQTQTIQIIDTTPPVILDCPIDMTVQEGPDNVNLVVSASDNCGSVVLTNNALTDYGQGNGMEDASGTYPEGEYDIRFIADDGCNNFDTCDVHITVEVDFDMALSQSIISLKDEYNPGDTVHYRITISNEGDVDAFDIDIKELLPSGMNFDGPLNPNWVLNVSTMRTTVDGPLAALISSDVDLFLIVDNVYDGLCIDSNSEIEDATSVNGGSTTTDKDSTPNNGVASEDDYDTEYIVSTVNLNDHSDRKCADASGNADFVLIDYDDKIYTGSQAVVISYHDNQSDAENDVNPIIGTYSTDDDILFVRIESLNNTMCYGIRQLMLKAFCSTPILSDVPQDITTSCDDTFSFGADPIVSDTCGAILSMTVDSVPGDCIQEYKLTKTWTATNTCGNSVDTSQTINVVDNTAPIISGVFDITVDEGDFVNLIAEVMDNCAPDDSITVSNDAPVGDGMKDASGVYPLGETTVTFEATDPCGNVSTVPIKVTVEADLMALANDTTIYISNQNTLFLDPGSFDDGSTGNPIGYELNPPFIDCNYLGSNDIMFIVINAVGKRDTDIFELKLLPKGLPLIINKTELTLNEDGSKTIQPDDLFESPINLCNSNLDWRFTPASISCTEVNSEVDVEVELLNSNGERLAITNGIVRVTDPINACAMTSSAMIAGNIYMENGAPMSNVEVDIVGSGVEAMTNLDGHFEKASLTVGQDYAIIPKYDQGDAKTGVNTLDLLMIRRHILQLERLKSPYNMIAADVNRSGTITALDMAMIRSVILRISDTYPNGKIWDFIPSDFEFSYDENPFYTTIPREILVENFQSNSMSNDFVMLKMGDVNSSINVQSTSNRSDSPIQLEWNEVTDGQYYGQYLIDILPQNDSLYGMQFAVKLPDGISKPNVMVGRISGLSPENVNYDEQTATIYFSWDNINGVRIQEKTTILRIDFKENTLSEINLGLNENQLIAEAYGTNNALHAVKLNPSKIEENKKALILYQNKPNPVKESTFIGFELGQGSLVRIEILDTDGQLIYSDRRVFSPGYGEFIVNAQSLKLEGVYFYRVSTEKVSLTKKMITIR